MSEQIPYIHRPLSHPEEYVFKLAFKGNETPYIIAETKEKAVRELNTELERIKKDFTRDYAQEVEIAKLRLDIDTNVNGYFSSIEKLKKRWLSNTNLHINNLTIYKKEANNLEPSDGAIYSVPTIGRNFKIYTHKDIEEIKPNMFSFDGCFLDLNKKDYNGVFYTDLDEAKKVLNKKIDDNINYLLELNNKIQNI